MDDILQRLKRERRVALALFLMALAFILGVRFIAAPQWVPPSLSISAGASAVEERR